MWCLDYNSPQATPGGYARRGAKETTSKTSEWARNEIRSRLGNSFTESRIQWHQLIWQGEVNGEEKSQERKEGSKEANEEIHP